MSSREAILAKVRQNKPASLALPEVPLFNESTIDRIERFREVLTFVGGTVLDISGGDTSLETYLETYFSTAKLVVSTVPLAAVTLQTVTAETDKATLEQVDVAILKGEFAVAENGAVWVPEANMLHRALPFIAQHLILVVDRMQFVLTMHEAYQRMDKSALSYGVFIAGPSKTADIEQSLVIGAHGARSLTVVLR